MAEKKPPVPYEEFQRLQSDWQQSKKLTGQMRKDAEEMLRFEFSELMQKYDEPIDKTNSLLDFVADKGLEGMDYVQGLPRGAIIAGGEAAQGNFKQAGQDLLDTAIPFEGRPAPSFLEARDRYPSIPQNGMTTGLAVAADVLTGPSAINNLKNGLKAALVKVGAAKGASTTKTALELAQELKQKPGVVDALKGVGKFLLDPAGKATEATGNLTYRSAFANADRASMRAGQGRVSDVAKKNNVWGFAGSVVDQLKGIAGKNSDDVAAMIKKTMVDLPDQAMTKDELLARAKENLTKAGETIGTRDEAIEALKVIEDKFKHLPGDHKFDLGALQKEKQAWQTKARDSGAYASQPQTATQKATGAVDNKMEARVLGDAYADLAQSARRGVEDGLDSARKGQGGEAFIKNRETAAILTAEKALEQQAAKSAALRTLLATAAAGGGASLFTEDKKTAGALGLLGFALSSTPVRTAAGLGLSKAAPLIGGMGRAAAVETHGRNMREPSPWSLLKKEMEQK